MKRLFIFLATMFLFGFVISVVPDFMKTSVTFFLGLCCEDVLDYFNSL